MSTSILRERRHSLRVDASRPSRQEIDAMLQAVNTQSIQQDLAPEPAVSPEIGWTVAAATVGTLAGGVSGALFIGGWLAALAGVLLGAAIGVTFAVVLWRMSDGGWMRDRQPQRMADPLHDDLLSGW